MLGIGVPMPAEKLDVNGTVKANALTLNSGGSAYDFLMKSNASGRVGLKKGHGALGMYYIISLGGLFPNLSGVALLNQTYLGEIN
ncbi:MAG: hypothetical protein WKF35_06405 [Ferruginibacter sp.]